VERGSVRVNIQELLDQEAELSNAGQSKSEERMKIHTMIRLARSSPSPVCFGEDDCSALMLSHCPWRIDCGSSI
jgi:hypothetical protein